MKRPLLQRNGLERAILGYINENNPVVFRQ
jgi:hypothetical protein